MKIWEFFVLDEWIKVVTNGQSYSLIPIAGDASLRSYSRLLLGDESYIVMNSQNDPSLPQYVRINQLLHQYELTVPIIHQVDVNKGFCILSDLGTTHYLDVLNDTTADDLYQRALSSLVQLQSIPFESIDYLPYMTQDRFFQQLDLFETWFLKKHLSYELSDSEQTILTKIFLECWDVNVSQPKVVCHVDYHSRNLLDTADKKIGILDFQDAWIGPIMYDLVSLLQDLYISWDRERVIKWLKQFQERENHLLKTTSLNSLLYWFDLTGLQRHFKNLGVFSRLCYRDNKTNYLKHIPQILNYIEETILRYPSLKPAYHLIANIQKKIHYQTQTTFS